MTVQETGTETIERQTVVENGFIIDSKTGEVLGAETPPEYESPKPSEVISDDYASWMLRKELNTRARISATQFESNQAWDAMRAKESALIEEYRRSAEYIELNATYKSSQALLVDLDKKIAFIESFWYPMLGAWAKLKLGSGKSKTWKTPWASISLRSGGGGYSVDDESKAVEWCRLNREQAVQSKILVSKLGDLTEKELEAAGLSLKPKTESVTVSMQIGEAA